MKISLCPYELLIKESPEAPKATQANAIAFGDPS